MILILFDLISLLYYWNDDDDDDDIVNVNMNVNMNMMVMSLHVIACFVMNN